MRTYSIKMLHLVLAVEAQLVVCSAMIKEIKNRPASQRHTVLAWAQRLTHSRRSLYNAAQNPDSHIWTSCDSLLCVGMERHWNWISDVNKLYLHQCVNVHLIRNIVMLEWFYFWQNLFEFLMQLWEGGFKMLMVFEFWFWRRNKKKRDGPKETRGPLFSWDTLTGLCLFDESELKQEKWSFEAELDIQNGLVMIPMTIK